jgi:hypothetical protein
LQTLNNSQNTLFPTCRATGLHPAQNCLIQPRGKLPAGGTHCLSRCGTYVNLERNFNSSSSGSNLDIYKEAGGVTTKGDHRSLINTSNLILRLDRNPAMNAYSGYYSVDGGANWIQLTGTLTQIINNPRLAIQVGANLAANTPSADLAWVEIIDPNSLPAPTVSGVTPGACEQGQQCTVTITGTNFQSGAACSFGASITTNSCTFISTSQLSANLTILPTATSGSYGHGPHPESDGDWSTDLLSHKVTPVTPTTAPNPNTGSQGQNCWSLSLAQTSSLERPVTSTGIPYKRVPDTSAQLTANIPSQGRPRGIAYGDGHQSRYPRRHLANAFSVRSAIPGDQYVDGGGPSQLRQSDRL